MANVDGPYTDEGTGAYEGPPPEVTYESAVAADPTGAVEGPPAETTVESPAGDEVTGSTGAVEGPPAEVTTYEWPAQAPKKTSGKAVSSDEDDVEDKAVRGRGTTKK